MNFANEQMTETFDVRMKTHSIDPDIIPTKKSRLFYRINQDKLIKYRRENQLRHNEVISSKSILIHRKTIGTQTTSSEEESNSSSTNSTDPSSVSLEVSDHSSVVSSNSSEEIVRPSSNCRVYIREMLGDDDDISLRK